MKIRNQLRGAAGLLLLTGLTSCRHAVAPPPQPAAIAPTVTPSTNAITVITPLPSVPPEHKADVRPAPAEQPRQVAVPVPVKRVHRLHRRVAAPPVNTASEAPPTQTVQMPQTEASAAGTNRVSTMSPVFAPASSPSSSSSSAAEAAPQLGELSTGTAISGSERTKILSQIQSQELRLSRLKEVASSEIASVQTQVRSFLAKARQAVTENDLDGAQTLNTKARVLLDELAGE